MGLLLICSYKKVYNERKKGFFVRTVIFFRLFLYIHLSRYLDQEAAKGPFRFSIQAESFIIETVQGQTVL